jgi:hypothetical protein
MIKYHKSIGFKDSDVIQCKVLLDRLNQRPVKFSSHALTELSQEAEAVTIGQRIKDYTLSFNDVFELAIDSDRIEKIGFRIPFNDKDIVFILSKDKLLITSWLNKKEDIHFTLNKSFYAIVNH